MWHLHGISGVVCLKERARDWAAAPEHGQFLGWIVGVQDRRLADLFVVLVVTLFSV